MRIALVVAVPVEDALFVFRRRGEIERALLALRGFHFPLVARFRLNAERRERNRDDAVGKRPISVPLFLHAERRAAPLFLPAGGVRLENPDLGAEAGAQLEAERPLPDVQFHQFFVGEPTARFPDAIFREGDAPRLAQLLKPHGEEFFLEADRGVVFARFLFGGQEERFRFFAEVRSQEVRRHAERPAEDAVMDCHTAPLTIHLSIIFFHRTGGVPEDARAPVAGQILDGFRVVPHELRVEIEREPVPEMRHVVGPRSRAHDDLRHERDLLQIDGLLDGVFDKAVERQKDVFRPVEGVELVGVVSHRRSRRRPVLHRLVNLFVPLARQIAVGVDVAAVVGGVLDEFDIAHGICGHIDVALIGNRRELHLRELGFQLVRQTVEEIEPRRGNTFLAAFGAPTVFLVVRLHQVKDAHVRVLAQLVGKVFENEAVHFRMTEAKLGRDALAPVLGEIFGMLGEQLRIQSDIVVGPHADEPRIAREMLPVAVDVDEVPRHPLAEFRALVPLSAHVEAAVFDRRNMTRVQLIGKPAHLFLRDEFAILAGPEPTNTQPFLEKVINGMKRRNG